MFNIWKQSACYECISLTLGWSREHRQSVTAEPNVRVRREIFTKNIKSSANTRHRSMEMGSLLIINSLDLWSDLPQAAKQAGLTNWSTYVDKLEKTQNRICAGMQLEWNLDDDQQLISVCRTYMDFDFLEPFVKKNSIDFDWPAFKWPSEKYKYVLFADEMGLDLSEQSYCGESY